MLHAYHLGEKHREENRYDFIRIAMSGMMMCSLLAYAFLWCPIVGGVGALLRVNLPQSPSLAADDSPLADNSNLPLIPSLLNVPVYRFTLPFTGPDTHVFLNTIFRSSNHASPSITHDDIYPNTSNCRESSTCDLGLYLHFCSRLPRAYNRKVLVLCFPLMLWGEG